MSVLSRRQALLGLTTTLCGLGASRGALALTDLLKTPARTSPLAARSLMLGVTEAGRRLIAVGERGLIVWSDDAGERWQQARVPVSVTLTAVAFADARRGWAVGHDGAILHSQDAGETWSLQFDGLRADAVLLTARKAAVQTAATPALRDQAESALADLEDAAQFSPSRPFLSVCVQKAADRERVWVAGAFGQLFMSEDGGQRWNEASTAIANPDGLHLNQISVLADGSLAVAGEAGKVYRADAGGGSWRVFDTGYNGHLYGVMSGPAAGSLVAYGFSGHAFLGDDEGRGWQALTLPTRQTLVAGVRQPGGMLLLVDRERRVLASEDARRWRLIHAQTSRPLASVAALSNPARLAVAGVGGVGVLALNLV